MRHRHPSTTHTRESGKRAIFALHKTREETSCFFVLLSSSFSLCLSRAHPHICCHRVLLFLISLFLPTVDRLRVSFTYKLYLLFAFSKFPTLLLSSLIKLHPKFVQVSICLFCSRSIALTLFSSFPLSLLSAALASCQQMHSGVEPWLQIERRRRGRHK